MEVGNFSFEVEPKKCFSGGEQDGRCEQGGRFKTVKHLNVDLYMGDSVRMLISNQIKSLNLTKYISMVIIRGPSQK